MAGYIRQSTFVDGDTITAALFNNEYNQLVNAFSNTSGHKHDGTTAEGPVIGLIGDAGETSPNNKVLIDTTNNYIEFYVEVASAPVQQLYIADGAIIPVTDSDIDLGTTLLRFKDAYIDSVTTTGNVSIGGNLTVTGNATISGNLTFGDADTDSINLAAEIDSHIVPNTDNTYDLGTTTKEWRNLYIDGIANIDSLVADTADINGGTIDGVTIGGTSAGAVTFTDLSDGTITIAGFADEDNMVSNSATLLPTQQSVKAYVDSQVTAQDLDFQGDTGGALSIDLDSESLTIAGGTGIDTSGATNTLTVAIDSTVATLTGTQTLTNKTLTSPDVNTPDIDGGTIDSSVIGGTTPTAGTFTTLTANTSITGTLATAAQPNITSLGTLTGLTTTGTLTIGTEDNNAAILEISGGPTGSGEGGEIRLDTAADYDGTYEFYRLDVSEDDFRIGRAGQTDFTIFSDGTAQFAGNLAATLSTAAQPNITSVGTLTGLTVNGDATFTGASYNAVWDSSADSLIFADNAKAIFGTSGDLQIYHDGSNSYIKDLGTGDLLLSGNTGVQIQSDAGENMITTAANGAVSLFYDSLAKLTTTSTGVDVTGTVVADGVEVDGLLHIDGSDNSNVASFALTRTDASWSIDNETNFRIYGNTGDTTNPATKRFEIGTGGDISFYDDTGTSQALFWDASAESLGIGTSSPDGKLHVESSSSGATAGAGGDELILESSATTGLSILSGTANDGNILFGDSGNSAIGYVQYKHADNALNFGVNGGLKATIDSSGNVGIGTDSPSNYSGAANDLVIAGSGQKGMTIATTDGSQTSIFFADSDSGTGEYAGAINYFHSDDHLEFYTASAERMRIDSSGNVGIGTTNGDVTNDGTAARTYVGIIGSGNRGRLNLGSTASNGADAGTLCFTNGANSLADITVDTTSGVQNTGTMYINGTRSIKIQAAASDEVVFNEGSLDVDFRVESNGNDHMLFVDGGNDKVRVGTSASSQTDSPFNTRRNGANIEFGHSNNGAGYYGTLGAWGSAGHPYIGLSTDCENSTNNFSTRGHKGNLIYSNVTSGDLIFAQLTSASATGQTPTTRMVLDSDGEVGIGIGSPDAKLHSYQTSANYAAHFESANANSYGVWIEAGPSANNGYPLLSITDNGGSNNYFRVDSGTGNVGIKNSSPSYLLDVGNTSSTTSNIFRGTVNGDFIFNLAKTTTSLFSIRNNNVGIVHVNTQNSATLALGVSTGTAAGTTVNQLSIASNGTVTIPGALSKGSGSFKIDHPLESKKDTHNLVHSFVEAPQADLIYRGKVDLVDGSATVNIDTVAGMTEGTFVALNTDVQCFTSNESDWDAVKGSISGNVLTISCQNTSSTATVSWMVIGERQDQHMIDTDWTDDNGKVIVEPLKPEEPEEPEET